MKKLFFTILTFFVLTSVSLANQNNKTFSAAYHWQLTSPGIIQLVKNNSSMSIGIMYSVDNDSDTVVVRCPMNDAVVQRNQTFICKLFPGEIAKVELKPYYFSRGASGYYTILA